MLSLRRLATGNTFRGMTAVMAVLLVLFCSSGVVSALAGDHGCQGSESSARVCGQSGVADPLPAIIEQTPLVQSEREPATLGPVLLTPLRVSKFHAAPSVPRAPPFSLV